MVKATAENKQKKSWYKRWWAITLFIIVGFMILGAMFGDDTSNQNNSNQNSGNQIVANNQQVEVPKTYSLGDSIQAGDFTWKITKVSTASQVGEEIYGTLMGEKADGIFLILDVEVSNTGKSAQYLMDSFVKLVDEQGREFSPSTSAAFYLKPQGSALMFDQINPGITKKGKIVYDVPQGLKVADVRISSNLVSSSFYNVKLMI